MMAEKARVFGDVEIERKVLASNHPGEAKKLGRRIASFDKTEWSKRCLEIVVRGNLAKFTQNESLGRFLIDTGSKDPGRSEPQ